MTDTQTETTQEDTQPPIHGRSDAIEGSGMTEFMEEPTDDDVTTTQSEEQTVNADGQPMPPQSNPNAQELDPYENEKVPESQQKAQPDETTQKTEQTTEGEADEKPSVEPAPAEDAQARREQGYSAAEEKEIEAATAKHQQAVMQQELDKMKAEQADDYDPDKPLKQEEIKPLEQEVGEIRLRNAADRINRFAEDNGAQGKELLSRIHEDRNFPLGPELMVMVSRSTTPIEVLNHLDKNRSVASELNHAAKDTPHLAMQRIAEISAKNQAAAEETPKLRSAQTREPLPKTAPKAPESMDDSIDQTKAYDKMVAEGNFNEEKEFYAAGDWA